MKTHRNGIRKKGRLEYMTNEDYIKSLPRKELAIALISTTDVPEYEDDDCFDIVAFTHTLHVTSDRMEFWDDYDAALEHECWWLAQERDDEES